MAIGVYAAARGGEDAVARGDWSGWQDETYNRMVIAAKVLDARIHHRTDSVLAIAAMARDGLGLARLSQFAPDNASKLLI